MIFFYSVQSSSWACECFLFSDLFVITANNQILEKFSLDLLWVKISTASLSDMNTDSNGGSGGNSNNNRNSGSNTNNNNRNSSNSGTTSNSKFVVITPEKQYELNPSSKEGMNGGSGEEWYNDIKQTIDQYNKTLRTHPSYQGIEIY